MSSGSTLGMQMLSEVVLGGLDLVDDVAASAGVSLSLAQVVYVVLVLECSGAVLLVLEDLRQDTLGLS